MKITAAVIAAVALSFAVEAQERQTPQLAESIEVRVTNVDVVVSDRQGKPVRGLTQDDFEVLEGGKPQPITNFYEIREASGTAPLPEDEAAVPPEVTRRRVVIFIDNNSIQPLARNLAFKALESSLESLLRPEDEAMIVFWGGSSKQIVAPFTSDKAELLRNLREASKKISGGASLEATKNRIIEQASQMLADARAPSPAGERGAGRISIPNAYQIALESSQRYAEQLYAQQQNLLAGMAETIDTLAGVEGKKAMIFLGAELAELPGLELFESIDGMFRFDLPNLRPAAVRESGRSLNAEVRTLGRHASARGVTLYLVDTANRVRGGDPTEHMIEMEAAFARETNTPLAMANVAAITGGLAVRGGKSFEVALDTIVSDLSSYYSLGYRSPEAEGDRKITVRVKKPGLRVRSRTSYVARKGDEDIRDRVLANVFHSNVKSDFPVSVSASPGELMSDGSGQYKVQLTVTLPSTITLIPRDDSLVGEFAVYFATGTPSGAMSEVTRALQPMRFPGDAREAVEAQGTFNYKATLILQPGEQLVSVAVVDTVAGSAGYARTTVTVP